MDFFSQGSREARQPWAEGRNRVAVGFKIGAEVLEEIAHPKRLGHRSGKKLRLPTFGSLFRCRRNRPEAFHFPFECLARNRAGVHNAAVGGSKHQRAISLAGWLVFR